MMFYHARNLTEQALHSGVPPWEFVPTETLTEQIRKDKESRQQFYQTASTRHFFYTGTEPWNPNQRISKENPPRAIHAFTPEFDLPIPDDRINEAVAAMPFPPQYVERSLGGNLRLVWVLEKPLLVDTYEFCAFLLTNAVELLNLKMLPGLDAGAFTTPTRLLCNGCNWRATGKPPISETALQAFLVKCGREYRYVSNDPQEVPLDIVEKAIVEKYGQVWPSDFTEGSVGPSFWVEGSTSPSSAIVKSQGMFTFAGHAAKPFYSWSDLLGADFVKNFADDSMAKATADIWFDGRIFWKKNEVMGGHVSTSLTELTSHLTVTCRMSGKQLKNGAPSPLNTALEHIYKQGRIYSAAPFTHREQGIIEFQGKRYLNIYNRKPVEPAILAPGDSNPWGPFGNFPTLSLLLDSIFDPADQKAHFLAWYKHYYSAAINRKPAPGQNIFLMGGADTGKTVLNREVIGVSVGGYMDAAPYLTGDDKFNSELVDSPHWVVDDETVDDSAKLAAALKKAAANQQLRYHKKFEIPAMVGWSGRIGVTTNLDYVSSRSIGSLDNTSLDKTSLFRCVAISKFIFPARDIFIAEIRHDLPYLLRWLLDHEVPTHVERHARFGYRAYHEPTLLNQTFQTGKAAPFKELLIDSLADFFKRVPDAQQWRGTVTDLTRLIQLNPLNESTMRTVNPTQINRYLEMIQRESILECEALTGDFKTRVWIFKRFSTPMTVRLTSGISFATIP